MIGSFEIRIEFFKDACQKTLGTAQGKMEYLGERDGGLNGSITELLGFASFSGLVLMLPVLHCLLGDPEQYFTSIHQCLIVLFPVSYLVLLLLPSRFLLSWLLGRFFHVSMIPKRQNDGENYSTIPKKTAVSRERGTDSGVNVSNIAK